MRRFLLSFLLLAGLTAPAFAAPNQDPCAGGAFKTSAPVSMSSATTTAIVSLNTHGIYVCGFALTIAGTATTAATAALEYGTSTACSSPTTLTGTFGSNDAAVSTTPTAVFYGDGSATVAVVPPNNDLCVVTTGGTGILVQGIITYVQATGNGYP